MADRQANDAAEMRKESTRKSRCFRIPAEKRTIAVKPRKSAPSVNFKRQINLRRSAMRSRPRAARENKLIEQRLKKLTLPRLRALSRTY